MVKAVSAQETAMRKRTAAGTLMCAPQCCTAATAPPVEGLVPDKDLQALLAEYPDVTGPLTGPSKLTAPVEVVEQLPGSKPTWRPPFRLSTAEKATVEEQVQDLLAKGFIRPSSSPFGAPVLFVPKPDGRDHVAASHEIRRSRGSSGLYRALGHMQGSLPEGTETKTPPSPSPRR